METNGTDDNTVISQEDTLLFSKRDILLFFLKIHFLFLHFFFLFVVLKVAVFTRKIDLINRILVVQVSLITKHQKFYYIYVFLGD